MNLYLKTTNDDLELPIAVADTAYELARMLHCTSNQVYSSISHKYRGWYKVEIDDLTGGNGS